MTMARPGVTYQDIVTAANELKGQGKNVTIESVRGILGTGSIGTINQHLRKWKETQASIYNTAAKENLPDSIIALMKGLWEGLITQSSEQFLPIEDKFKQEILELKCELEKYKNNNQRWQKMFDQWQQEKTLLANEKLILEQALDFAHKENATLQTKQDGLHYQLQEKQARIDELYQLHQQTQRNLEHYRESAREQRLLDQQQFEREKQQHLAEIKTLKEEIVRERHEITSSQKKNAALLEANQFLERSYSQCQKENEQLKSELATANSKYNENLVTCQVYENQNKQLLVTVTDQSNQIITYQAENKISSKKLSEIINELSTTKDQLKLIAQEKWELIQAKARLEGQLSQMQKFHVT